ncbi:hypothetical protein B0F90DRAFT_1760824 [Multifurca ochricompacta]|uniref:Uncharacterized protein n=1 Tax=Multifurca ochricompacta TaxID=376703 RepID=A0AAD4QK67_9AGAM|nr:hypothetical protein B0F90DRAFT_1760824 [Multifurca ochricompacta]
MSSNCDVSLGYNLLVVGDKGGPIRSHKHRFTNLSSSTESGVRSNQKSLRLADNRILVLDIIERPGDIFRECCGSSSLASFQYVVRFHEQIAISKWRFLPVVLFSGVLSKRGVKHAHGCNGHRFAEMHTIPFVEASPNRPFPAPFVVLLSLVRQHYETSTTPTMSFREGIIEFLTVAAAKVSHAVRSHDKGVHQ